MQDINNSCRFCLLVWNQTKNEQCYCGDVIILFVSFILKCVYYSEPDTHELFSSFAPHGLLPKSITLVLSAQPGETQSQMARLNVLICFQAGVKHNFKNWKGSSGTFTHKVIRQDLCSNSRGYAIKSPSEPDRSLTVCRTFPHLRTNCSSQNWLFVLTP